MMRNKLRFSMLMVMLATIFGGCTSNKITMQYDSTLHKVWTRVYKNDVVSFRDANTHPFVPDFPLGSPCTDDGDLANGMCTISGTKPPGKYPFACGGCADPEIVVGSSTQPMGDAVKMLSAVPTDPVDMGCISNSIKIYPVEVKEHKSDEATIHWEGAGPTPLKDWTVNNFKTSAGASADVCKLAPPFNEQNPDCTLDKDKVTTGMTYTYTVSSTSCPTPAEGKITIK